MTEKVTSQARKAPPEPAAPDTAVAVSHRDLQELLHHIEAGALDEAKAVAARFKL